MRTSLSWQGRNKRIPQLAALQYELLPIALIVPQLAPPISQLHTHHPHRRIDLPSLLVPAFVREPVI